jgi:hypothetical protein
LRFEASQAKREPISINMPSVMVHTSHPNYMGGIVGGSQSEASLGKNARPYLKNKA